MKCPKCRKEMAYDAVEHGCGWKLPSRVARTVAVVDDPPASREVVEASLVKIAAILKRPRTPVPVSEEVRKLRGHVPMLRDVGHGEECTCEVCWAARLTREGRRGDTTADDEFAGGV